MITPALALLVLGADSPSLEALLATSRPPIFFSEGTHRCVVWETEAGERPRWHLFKPEAPYEEARTLDDPSPELAEQLVEQCGEPARQYLALSWASCRGPAELAHALTASPSTSYVPPAGTRELAAFAKDSSLARSYWNAGRHLQLGCATLTTAANGLARVWVQSLETLDEGSLTRGTAFLTWTDARGVAHVQRDAVGGDDLHLDTVVDELIPLPGTSDRYLALGLRAYRATFPGKLPRRWAQVLKLGTDGRATLVPASFHLRGAPRERLLLAGPVPVTGKFRHAALAHLMLRFEANVLTLVPLDDGEMVGDDDTAALPHASPTGWVVARLSNGHFELVGARVGPLTVETGWGK